ncbi:MAG TPA: GAF domain-containing SpoIIE family protein phosphatase [Acidimicrobiia bacterium]|nr:GAF domain-containing SpoIIE family protein phosphatase [Acidimicrobiia bacterium]
MTSHIESTDVDGDLAQEVEHLRRIQSVTDASLAHLEIDELLDTLLERTREILEADTAAVLLIDRAAQEMVATAAKGIEEEVRGGVRIPIGEGFAGRVAAEGRPVILEHVDHTNVRNPILLELGIRSLLGVPLVADGETIGVLHVGTLGSRSFTQQDAELLQLVADRAALVINTSVLKQERRVATALQRSLLPRLPDVSGLEIAARYIPGSPRLVGGDWYDLFELPTGHVGAAIGDVVGHGLQSAIVMGRLRNALRAYALDSSDPATVLTRLDEMVSHFEADEMATVLYAVIDPDRRRMTCSSAGHPFPFIASPSGEAAIVDARANPPIGSCADIQRGAVDVSLPLGSTVYLFTDGVVERRGEHIDVGLERLRNAVIAGSPHRGCTRIVTQLMGDTQLEDDFAVLALHVRAADQ